jgi:phosphoribosylformylglycinamidine synthase
MRFDAKVGAIDSIAYPALELAAKGFEVMAATDCLNFGNPEQKEIMSQFVATIEGLSAQCEALSAPIISGNVSFYNETMGENITSTPATGLVGLANGVDRLPHDQFQNKNSEVFLLSAEQLVFNGQWAEMNSVRAAGAGQIDVEKQAEFVALTRDLVRAVDLEATRVVGKFGLGYALARMCNGRLGFLAESQVLSSTDWFLEKLYQVILVVDADQALSLRKTFEKLKLNQNAKLQRIGQIVDDRFSLGDVVDCRVSDIQASYQKPWEVLIAGLS